MKGVSVGKPGSSSSMPRMHRLDMGLSVKLLVLRIRGAQNYTVLIELPFMSNEHP